MATQAQLMSMTKEDLVDGIDRAIAKVKSYKEKAASVAAEMLDYVFAGLGAGVAGWWLGSIQREIDAGTEGYDADSLKVYGVEKDLIFGLVMAGASFVPKIGKKLKGAARGGSLGALSFWLGRRAYQMSYEQEEEEED